MSTNLGLGEKRLRFFDKFYKSLTVKVEWAAFRLIALGKKLIKLTCLAVQSAGVAVDVQLKAF